MLLGADPAFAPSTGHLDATVLAVPMLLLLQPSCKSRGALQYFGQNGGTVFFTTTSQAVVSDLAQLRAQRLARRRWCAGAGRGVTKPHGQAAAL